MLTTITALAVTAFICLVIPSTRLLGVAILIFLAVQFPIVTSGLAMLGGLVWFFLKR